MQYMHPFILKWHHGRWHVKNAGLFKQASKQTKDPIALVPSWEANYVWLIFLKRNRSHRAFWLEYRILVRNAEKENHAK